MRGREEGERLGTPSRGRGLTSFSELRFSQTRRPFCSEGRGWAWGRGEGVALCRQGSQDYRALRLLPSWICELSDP